MEPFLRSLILRGFRSFDQERVDFDNPTILVGQNGSGKSNLVDAIAFLAEVTALPLQAVVTRRGGALEIIHQEQCKGLSTEAEILKRHPGPRGLILTCEEEVYTPTFGLAAALGPLDGDVAGARYSFEVRVNREWDEEYDGPLPATIEVQREQCILWTSGGQMHWFDRAGDAFRTDIASLNPGLDPAALGLPVVGGDAHFAPVLRALRSLHVNSIDPVQLGQVQVPDNGLRLRRDGRNAASVLRSIERHSSDDMNRIVEILATIVPDVIQVRPVPEGKGETLEFILQAGDRKRLRLRAANMSHGTLRALGLVLAVYQRPRPSLLVIEEPEATIHPGAIGAIMDLIRHASRSMQVIVTTHSPDLLDAKWVEDKHLRVVVWEEGSSRVLPVSEGSRRVLQKHLMGAGELLRSNALEPAPATDRTADLFEAIP
jgi:predicted ATPase